MPLDSHTPVLIAGAGYVGRALIDRLGVFGCPVYALKRDHTQHPRGAMPIVADLTHPESLAALPTDLRFVVYLVSPDAAMDEAYRAAYVDGLRNLLECAPLEHAPIERVLFASSTAVYAQDDGEWIDEYSPTVPQRFSGRRLLEAERLLADSGLPHTIVRFAGIYGPGRERLIESVLAGRARASPAPNITNRIHRDDCAGFLCHLMTLTKPEPLYLGVDDAPTELQVVLEWIADRAGLPPPRVTDTPAIERRAGNKRCSNQRLHASGYELSYPTFKEGYGALLDARQG